MYIIYINCIFRKKQGNDCPGENLEDTDNRDCNTLPTNNGAIVSCKSMPKGCRDTDCEGMYYVEVIGNLTLKWGYRVDNHCDNTNFRVRVWANITIIQVWCKLQSIL